MKTLMVAICFLTVAVTIFAAPQTELNASTSALVHEITSTLSEVKGMVGEYAPALIEGLVARKLAYYQTVFPAIPIVSIVAFCLALAAFISGFFVDEIIAEDFLLFAIGFFLLLGVVFGIWALADWFGMKQFMAAPEVTVFRGLIHSVK